MFGFKILTLCLAIGSLITAYNQNSFSAIQKSLIAHDLQRAERIAKESLAAAAEAEHAAMNLQYQHSRHAHDLKFKKPYQVYSQHEYDQKTLHFKQVISQYTTRLYSLHLSADQEDTCKKMGLFFRNFDELIHYNPEYATPPDRFQQSLDFFKRSHQIWSQLCHQHKVSLALPV